MKYNDYQNQLAYGSFKQTIKDVAMSHLVFGTRRSTTEMTIAKAALTYIKARLNVAGQNSIDLIDSNLLDLAWLTDFMGGYGFDPTATDLSDWNVVLPMGIDVFSGKTLEFSLETAQTVANAKMTMATIDDNTRAPLRKIRTVTLAGSGMVPCQNAIRVFARKDAAGTAFTASEIIVKRQTGELKRVPVDLASIVCAKDSQMEKESFGYIQLFVSTQPENLEITLPEAGSIIAIEA